MQNISGFGLMVQIVASNTFPSGFTVTDFADDSDPLDNPSIQIADKAMGLNGDLIIWATPKPIIATLNVIPQSSSDNNLQILLDANRVGQGKTSAQDQITMTILYPNGNSETLTVGAITDGMAGNSVASAGRLKTKAYIFAFENKIGVTQ